MNGRDFLSAALRQASSGHESDWRSSASRAYYAAFHVARDLLTALGFTTPAADRAHEYLYHRLNNCGMPAVQQAASVLHDLRRRRNRADYDIQSSFTSQVAATAVTQANDVIRTLDAISSAQLAQIMNAIKAYEQQIGHVTWKP
jgi:uncharacterized protein (UPF0332 family)